MKTKTKVKAGVVGQMLPGPMGQMMGGVLGPEDQIEG